MNEKLKPCPFCGEKRIYLNTPKGKFKGSINCPACLASIPNELSDEAELIECWNTRKPLDKQLIEEKEMLDFAIERPSLFAKIVHENCGGTEYEELARTRKALSEAMEKN